MNSSIPQNETIEDGHVHLVAADALAATERSQIDMQIATAKKYPRSIKSFLDESTSMIALSPEIAEGCSYKLKRKNADGGITYIEGPSVRLLEIAASAFGNLRYGSRVVGIDEEFVTVQGVAQDMERNNFVTLEVKRSIKGKRGRFSSDMIMVTANAAGSIARRNALNGNIIPRVYINALMEHAKKVALGDIKTLPERRQRAFDYFTKSLGVPLEKVLEYLEKKSVEDCNLADVSDLQDLKTALKEGQSTVEEIFSDKPATPSTGHKPPLEAKEAIPPKKATEPLPPLPNEGPSNKRPAKAAAQQPSSELQNAGHIPDAKAAPSVTAEAGQNAGSDVKRTTGPTSDGSAKTVEQAAPNPSSADGAKEVAQPATAAPPDETAAASTTNHDKIQAELTERGVGFDDFKDWLANSGRLREANAMKDIAELPQKIAADILAQDAKGARPLDRCLKLFGK